MNTSGVRAHYTGPEFWRNYMEGWLGAELIDKRHEYVSEVWIDSGGHKLHLEIYDCGNPCAPTLVWSHGIAGYARLMLPFVVPLREKGYNVVCPDLQGYGYNEGRKGEFTWNAHAQNLIDTAAYARARFSGLLVLGGASMGGPLAYEAASRCGGVDACAFWCLWEIGDPEFMATQSKSGRLTHALKLLLRLAEPVCGNIRLRISDLFSYDTLTDSSEFNALVLQDPQAGRYITLRGAASLLTQTGLTIPYREWKLPTLVVQPGADAMIPAKYVVQAFSALGSEMKRYVELEGAAHFPVQKNHYDGWAAAFDSFVRWLEDSARDKRGPGK